MICDNLRNKIFQKINLNISNHKNFAITFKYDFDVIILYRITVSLVRCSFKDPQISFVCKKLKNNNFLVTLVL